MLNYEAAQHFYLLGFTGRVPFKRNMLGKLLNCLPVVPLFLRFWHNKSLWATTSLLGDPRVAPTITPFELVGPGILGVSCDKSQDALPGVSGSIGIVHGAPIKETMGSARIDDDLVFNACFHQLLFKAVHIAGRNALVGSTKQSLSSTNT